MAIFSSHLSPVLCSMVSLNWFPIPIIPLTVSNKNKSALMTLCLYRIMRRSAPSAYLTVSDGQTGVMYKVRCTCQIDFDAAPTITTMLIYQLNTGRREQITDINLKAASITAPVQ